MKSLIFGVIVLGVIVYVTNKIVKIRMDNESNKN